ncbi:IS3 family transposase [Pleionea sp. CnH1-48]|nr:IS3 family transposase [Pleionea sp. CnH1-48]
MSRLCQVLLVSRSGFYDWLKRQPSQRSQENSALTEMIKSIYQDSRGTYGAPRIHAELKRQGIQVSRKRIARLMREQGLRAKSKRRFKATTNSQHNKPIAPNLLAREFNPIRANIAWAADITYIPTNEGWLYLATVIDLYSRKIVGWSMSERMKTTLVEDALMMAIHTRQPDPGLVHHSDRGVQYASEGYQSLLTQFGMRCSMSAKGDCYDNAVMESFYHSLKIELVYHERYRTRDEARQSIFDYIEVFYNRQRLHSTLGYQSPVEYETAA